MTTLSVEQRLATRSQRLGAAIEICQQLNLSKLPALLATLEKLTWDEVGQLMPYLSLLGAAAVPGLCALLSSTRKQTAELVTTALGAIGDIRASVPLAQMMEAQAGSANAIRARDALSRLGNGALPTLSIALQSANWEVRYHAVQALAIIGDPAIIDDLALLATDDRSGKVREAAEDALGVIPCVGSAERWTVRQGFYNPWVVSPGFLPDWRVDVLNAHKPALLWQFDRQEFAAANVPLLIDDALLAAVLQGYCQVGAVGNELDVVVLMGDPTDAEGWAGSFGLAIFGLSDRLYPMDRIVGFLGAIEEYFPIAPIGGEFCDYWLGRDKLTPYAHLERGRVIRYDMDESHEPDGDGCDEEFGTGLPIAYAKAVVDQAWVQRSQLTHLQDHGYFTHIPAIPEADPAKRIG